MKKDTSILTILMVSILLGMGAVCSHAQEEPLQGEIQEQRSSQVGLGLAAGRDGYRATNLNGVLGMNSASAMVVEVAGTRNDFTDNSGSLGLGLDFESDSTFSHRAVLTFSKEPNEVRGIGARLRTRVQMDDFWEGEHFSLLNFEVQGTRYWDQASTVTGESESESGSSRRGRGRGGNDSALLSGSGIWQLSVMLGWTQELNDFWVADWQFRKYFYPASGSASDGNAAISDRLFVPSFSSLLVDGFPEWSTEFSVTWEQDSWDWTAFFAFTRARNTSDQTILTPGLEAWWRVNSSWSLGAGVSQNLSPASTLLTANVSYSW